MDAGALSRAAARARALALLLACAAGACTPRATVRSLVSVETAPRGENVVVIRDATVFPATSRDRRLVDFDVVIRDGVIERVEPTGGDVPRGARVIDGRGKTVLPGFIDPHVHVFGNGAPPWRNVEVPVAHTLEANLYAGVTTVYDLGGDGDALERLSDDVVVGRVVGPRIFHTGLPITAVGGHPVPTASALAPWPISALAAFIVPQARDASDAARLVDAQLAHHGDYVKLMRDALPSGTPELDDATLAALVQAAHARKKKVFVHVGSAADAVAAARAGADVLAHGVYRGRITREQAQEIAARGVKVIYTLANFERIAALAHEHFTPSALDVDTAPPEVLAPITGAAAHEMPDAIRAIAVDASQDEALWAANVTTMRDAGVEILPGSDSVFIGVPPGSAFIDDMRALVDAGLSPSEVLYEATAGASRLWLSSPSFGTLEVGNTADVVVVDGDPFADIAAAGRVAYVIRSGRVIAPIAAPINAR